MGGTTTYALSEEAYLTVLLHAAKYPSCTVCGVLLGQSVGGAVTVTKAIPLFHLSMLLAPAVDTALSQVRVQCVNGTTGHISCHPPTTALGSLIHTPSTLPLQHTNNRPRCTRSKTCSSWWATTTVRRA